MATTVIHTPQLVQRIYVWELPVRICHWIFVFGILVLSVTGLYMHDPVVTSSPTAWTMGTMRYIHECTGFVFSSAVLVRFYWFFAGNRWARWHQFLPIQKYRRNELGQTVKYYGFQGPAPLEIGHNPMAGLAYLAIFGLFLVEVFSGLALVNHLINSKLLGLFVGWLPRLIDLQYLRMIHNGVMYLFFAFAIHHIYSALLISWEERGGLIESIVTGWKFMKPSEIEEAKRKPE